MELSMYDEVTKHPSNSELPLADILTNHDSPSNSPSANHNQTSLENINLTPLPNQNQGSVTNHNQANHAPSSDPPYWITGSTNNEKEKAVDPKFEQYPTTSMPIAALLHVVFGVGAVILGVWSLFYVTTPVLCGIPAGVCPLVAGGAAFVSVCQTSQKVILVTIICSVLAAVSSVACLAVDLFAIYQWRNNQALLVQGILLAWVLFSEIFISAWSFFLSSRYSVKCSGCLKNNCCTYYDNTIKIPEYIYTIRPEEAEKPVTEEKKHDEENFKKTEEGDNQDRRT